MTHGGGIKDRLLLETVLVDVKLSNSGMPSDTGRKFHNSGFENVTLVSLRFHRKRY